MYKISYFATYNKGMKALIIIGILLVPFQLWSQSSNAPLNEDYYHLIDRYEIISGEVTGQFHSAWKPYRRFDIARYLDTLNSNNSFTSRTDRFNYEYLTQDNWEWVSQPDNKSKKPVLRHFYKTKSDLFGVQADGFDLHVNPVLHVGGGVESAGTVNTMINTRGVQIRGMIDKKVGFYSFIGENQVIFPAYVRSQINQGLVIPNEGFWKGFKDNGTDFFTARGYMSFNATRHIDFQFGHDRFKIGNGYRSLILSDYAPAYLFLKMNTKVWKLNYTNLFTQMTADVVGNASGLFAQDGGYPNKYMALHHLGINIGKKLNVGIFESVIFNRADSLGNQFQLRYLNPIVFYRAIEQQNGSSDNVLLGADFKWLAINNISLYGQLVFDEFLLDNLKEGDGWWGNKYSIQLGGEYINAFGLSNLDLQLEGNLSRPYTYSHGTQYGSYSHYRQPLAHPLGANFREVVAIARYQPMRKLSLSGKLIVASYGTDTTGVNYGGNILLDNGTREMDRGNEIGQGIDNQLFFADLTVSYQWKHNLFVDMKHIYRKVDSQLSPFSSSTHYSSLAIRWNIPQRLNEF